MFSIAPKRREKVARDVCRRGIDRIGVRQPEKGEGLIVIVHAVVERGAVEPRLEAH
ncbi:MAG: hypothetical protein HYS63_06110 [Methylocystis sp.]|nr:hypothetical protein [Methylocystis sp.]